MRLSETCDAFIAHCRAVANLSFHTLRAYEGDLAGFQSFFPHNPKISELNKDSIRSCFRGMRLKHNYKDSSLRRKSACLKLLFKWALSESLIEHSPFDNLNEKFRLPKALPRHIDSTKLETLRQALLTPKNLPSFSSLMHTLAISLLLETGIRVGELVDIGLEDISIPDQCILIHGKGNRQRIVYLMNKDVSDMAQEYFLRRQLIYGNCKKLLVTNSGQKVTTQAVRKFLKNFAKLHGITTHITPHMLRHTCATQWLSDGLDIRHVQKLLGHHSIATTEIYTHVSDRSLKNALQRLHERRVR